MCRPIKCSRCAGVMWSGCGMHVDQVMADVPRETRCTCDLAAPLRRLFSGIFRRSS